MSDFSITQAEAETLVTGFLDNYFKDIKDVVEFEQDFVETNSLETPLVDYFKLKRFIETSVRNLRAIDNNLLTGLVYKLYKDAMSLYSFYSASTSKVAMPKLIFERDFLRTIKYYKDLELRIEELKSIKYSYEMKMRYLEGSMKKVELEMDGSDAKRKEYANLKLRYAEATHFFAEARDEIPKVYQELEYIEQFFAGIFLDLFEEYKNYYLGELKNSTNAKFYYLDKLIWYKAERSPDIRRFFKEAGIKGSYDARTFINYYIKNIDVKKTFDKSWHTYLKDILTILE